LYAREHADDEPEIISLMHTSFLNNDDGSVKIKVFLVGWVEITPM